MFTLIQVLILVALLSSVVFGLPLAEDNFFERLAIDSDRIFGGQEAAVGQFPHQISLRQNFRHICGGSIITNRFVITAAHYIELSHPSCYIVVAGAHKRYADGKAYAVKRWIVHEKFYLNITATNATIRNDIALIETIETIEFNQLVGPIALNRKFVKDGVQVVTSGWGATNDQIDNLKFVNLTTLTNAKCRTALNHTNQSPPVHDFDTICAFTGRSGHGICAGDFGGPLLAEDKLIGLASWGWSCAKGYPDVFTRVGNYIDWIKSKTQSSF